IVDEVRRIGEDSLELETISEKLFALLSSILNYLGCALVVNHWRYSTLMIDVSKSGQEPNVKAYVSKLALQLGLPPLREEIPKTGQPFENALTAPVDTAGHRAGLLVVIPWPNHKYNPGDQKVVRLICEQLSTVLRLYLSHTRLEEQAVLNK